MKWRILFILLIASGLTACYRSRSPNDQDSIKKQKLADEIRHNAAIELKRELNLRPCGTMGQMLREVEKLGLSFYYYKPVDIAEGRALLLKAASTLVEKVNQEPRIYPYLSRCPFTPRNVEIEIFLHNPDGTDPSSNSLQVLTVREGILRYKIDHPGRVGFLTVYKETYAEALARLEDPSLPLAAFQPDREGTPEELEKLRKNISYVADDGSIWHLGPNGSWVKEPYQE